MRFWPAKIGIARPKKLGQHTAEGMQRRQIGDAANSSNAKQLVT
jgi:hypothetical protein